MTPAEVIALEAARYGRRGPPEDYGRFPERLSADELAEFFFFDERDRELICKRRRECNRLGFAVQLGTVRYLGRFLEDPCTVPEQVVRWIARELGVDASGLGAYARGEARWDHQVEIRREYGYREFREPSVELELVRWLEARAWVSAESTGRCFDRSVDHLIASKVLLPGASVLWRLVGTVCHRAAQRGENDHDRREYAAAAFVDTIRPRIPFSRTCALRATAAQAACWRLTWPYAVSLSSPPPFSAART